MGNDWEQRHIERATEECAGQIELRNPQESNAKTELCVLKSCIEMEFKNGVLAMAGIG